jgi:hypothetical protein
MRQNVWGATKRPAGACGLPARSVRYPQGISGRLSGVAQKFERGLWKLRRDSWKETRH